jgi:ribosome-associated protein
MACEGPEGGVEVAPGVRLPDAALQFTFVRSSGPGGQNVNKVATKARLRVAMNDLATRLDDRVMRRITRLAGDRLTHDGDLIITADESRSQRANRQACMDRLRSLIVEAQKRPRPRRRTRPTRASKERRLDEKKRRGQIKKRRGRPNDDT